MTSAPDRTPAAAVATPAPPLPAVPIPDGYRLVELDPEAEADEILDVDSWAFAFDLDPAVREILPMPLEAGRVVGVRTVDGELAALHGSYAFPRFGVPGGTLPVSGLTWVGVHPGHRRRGLARAMVLAHLERSRARGEAVSALFAAEPAIYGRFGYGCAARSAGLTLPRGAALRAVPGSADLGVTFERATPQRHADLVSGVHDAVERPGWARRHNPAHRTRTVLDVPAWRHGAEALRIAVVRDGAGEPRGYALFQRKEHWTDLGSPAGTVRVTESATLDGAAARALWGALTDLDLMVSVSTGILALDDPLHLLLVDARTAAPRYMDNIWVRLLDVPAALSGRRYAAEVDVVLEVSDAVVPANAGRWRLRGGPGGADVTPDDGAGHLALDVRDLGAAYLGGVSLAGLAGAGLVRELVPGTLLPASTAFSWPVAPVCNWVF